MFFKSTAQGLVFAAALFFGIGTQAQIAYIANACWYCFGTGADNGSVSVCDVNTDGSLATCSRFTDPAIYLPFDVVTNSATNTAYVFNSDNPDNNSIAICPVNTDGSLSACTSTVTLPTSYSYGGLRSNWSNIYFVDTFGNNVYVCPINSDGTLGDCTQLSDATFNGPNGRIAMSPDGAFAYVVNFYGGTVSICPINADGTFGSCTASDAPDSNSNATLVNPLGVDIDPTGNFIYISDSDILSNLNISVCAINTTDGSLSNCTTRYDTSFGTLNYVNNLFVANNAFAYVPNDAASTIAICGVNTDGSLGTCSSATDSTFAYPESVWISNGK